MSESAVQPCEVCGTRRAYDHDVYGRARVAFAAVPITPVALHLTQCRWHLVGISLDLLQADDIRTLALNPLLDLALTRPDPIDVPGRELNGGRGQLSVSGHNNNQGQRSGRVRRSGWNPPPRFLLKRFQSFLRQGSSGYGLVRNTANPRNLPLGRRSSQTNEAFATTLLSVPGHPTVHLHSGSCLLRPILCPVVRTTRNRALPLITRSYASAARSSGNTW